MKRFLIIFGIIVVVGGVVAAGFYLRSKTTQAPGAPSGGSLPAPLGGLPGGGTAGVGTPTGGVSAPDAAGTVSSRVSPISDIKLVDYVATSGVIIGADINGKVGQIDAGGAASSLSSSAIDNFFGASVSADGQKILASFGSPDNRQWSVFTITTKTWSPLQAGILSAAWKPASHAIAFVLEKAGVKTVYSLDTDNAKSKPVQLFSAHFEDMSVSWPSPNQITLAGRASGLAKNSFWAYDLKKKIFSAPFEDMLGTELKWDDYFTRGALFSGNNNGRGGILRLISGSGQMLNQFDFLTFPGKCLFAPDFSAELAAGTSSAPISPDEKFIYCAVPRDQNALKLAVLPDDYEKRSVYTSDNIYKIDLNEGTVVTIFDDPLYNFDVSNPKIFSGKYFFINRFDGKLYSLPLPQ